MNYQKITRQSFLIVFFFGLFSGVAIAGPHLKKINFSKSGITPYWGHLMILMLLAILLALFFFVFLARYFKVNSTLRLLRRLAKTDQNFHWPTLKQDFTGVFTNLHEAWSNNNAAMIAGLCTPMFWEEEQKALLNRWKKEGLRKKNVVGKINYLNPILVRHSNSPNAEGSTIVLNIMAMVESYFEDLKTGELREGKKGLQQIETFWTFQLSAGKWLLYNIEPSEFKSVYINLRNEAPKKAS